VSQITPEHVTSRPPTAEQHRRIVEARGRPYTDRGRFDYLATGEDRYQGSTS
jgi:hypothetical protein